MNPVFVSALRSNGGPGTAIRTASGTIPSAGPAALPTRSRKGTIARHRSAHGLSRSEIRRRYVSGLGHAELEQHRGVLREPVRCQARQHECQCARKPSVTQQPKSQAAPIAPSAASGQTQGAIASHRGDAQRRSAPPTSKKLRLPRIRKVRLARPRNRARSSRQMLELRPATNLLIGAVPTVRAGGFENRPVALGAVTAETAIRRTLQLPQGLDAPYSGVDRS